MESGGGIHVSNVASYIPSNIIEDSIQGFNFSTGLFFIHGLDPILSSTANRVLPTELAGSHPAATTVPATNDNAPLPTPATALQTATVEPPLAPILCSRANRLPAATFPMLDCHAAAMELATTPPGPKPIVPTAAAINDRTGMTINTATVWQSELSSTCTVSPGIYGLRLK